MDLIPVICLLYHLGPYSVPWRLQPRYPKNRRTLANMRRRQTSPVNDIMIHHTQIATTNDRQYDSFALLEGFIRFKKKI